MIRVIRMLPMLGVGVMSMAYLITGSPISAVMSHIAMHITAVLYGLQSVSQLPSANELPRSKLRGSSFFFLPFVSSNSTIIGTIGGNTNG